VISSSTTQVRRAFRVVNGGTPTSDEENWDGTVPWATPVDLGMVNGGRLLTTQRSLTELGLRAGSACVPGGSLIVSTRAPIGYVAEVAQRTAFNQGCRGLVPTVDLELRYFRYQFSALKKELQSRGQGSTFSELSSEGLAGIPLRVPDLQAQRAIADYLDAETARIDALIEKKAKVVRLLQERALAIVSGAWSGRARRVDLHTPRSPGQSPDRTDAR
jgi:type I restriction enzyme S subunit